MNILDGATVVALISTLGSIVVVLIQQRKGRADVTQTKALLAQEVTPSEESLRGAVDRIEQLATTIAERQVVVDNRLDALADDIDRLKGKP